MAFTLVAVQPLAANANIANATFTAADGTNGNQFPNDGRTVLVIKNGDASSHTVTVSSVPDELGRTGDMLITIPANSIAVVGLLSPRGWNQVSGADLGNVHLTWGATPTSVTFATFSLGWPN